MRRIYGLIAINVALCTALSFASPYFLTTANITNIIDNMALEAVALCGITLLLIGGLFDLSIDGSVALSGVVTGLLISSGVPWYLAVIGGIATSVAIAAINGLVVVRLRMNALVTTLATWWICVGITYGLTRAMSPHNFPGPFLALGQTQILGFRAFDFVALAIVAYSSFQLHLGVSGNHIVALGGGREAANSLGVQVDKLGMKLYITVGLLAGFVGIMTASRLNAASPMAVDGMAMRLIASAVLGGCSLSGGKGSIVGGILGLILFSLLGNATILLGVSPYWQKAVLGTVLISSVIAEKLKKGE
jgi:ribose/xylose/arabinose/galactoside ABC-type transport system permease subunit